MPEMGLTALRIFEIGILAAFIISIAYDSTRFIKREYTVRSKKVKKHCKVVLMSDLHNKSYGEKNKTLIKAVEETAPDIIVIAGDMLTASEKKAEYGVPVELMRCLAESYPVYYGNGNHEYRMKLYKDTYGDMYETYKNELKKYGVRILENERIYLPAANIEICGLEIEKNYYKRISQNPMPDTYIESLLGKSREDCFELLIAHNPEYFGQYAKWGAELTVSGHVHGGVMKLPFVGGVISPMIHFFPKYDGGLFEENGKRMIVSRGLGMHTIPLRIFNPGELVVINLEPE